MSNSRTKIINTIGADLLVKNLEADEFSYPKALQAFGKTIDESLVTYKGVKHKDLDIRFVKGNISVLVETKPNFDREDKDKVYHQLQAYVEYEKVLTGNKIIAILANTED